MKEPSEADKARSLDIRKRSKRGEYISKADLRWNNGIYKKYEEWYGWSEHIVFNATVPFGSNVRMEPPKKTDG